MTHWVMDTGPLSHFAQAGWLGVIKLLAPDNRIIVPDGVERELRAGIGARPWLSLVLDQDWIEVQPVQTEGELAVYARYANQLVGEDGRNTGECGVLALAEVHHRIAIVDDRAACKLGADRGVTIMRTLKLLFEGINSGHLSSQAVGAIADDLLITEYRIPVPRGGAIQWGIDNGLIHG